MKKKIFAMLLCLAMLFVLTSCGGKDSSETTGTNSAFSTDDTEKKDVDGEGATEKEDQEPKVASGAEANGTGIDGSAKPGGKDPGKSSETENEKSTGKNTSETAKPNGGKQGGTASADEPKEKDSEGELVAMEMPVVKLR